LATGGGKHLSFHGWLGRYSDMNGRLTLDDGTVLPVQVRGPFLHITDEPEAS
jgi:hypothetical protein